MSVDTLKTEIARRYGPGATIEPDPQRAYLKVARRGRLSGRQLSALRAVAAWREEEARSRDLPPGWVLKDPSVVEVARRNPADAAALGRLRGLGNLSAPASQRVLEAAATRRARPGGSSRAAAGGSASAVSGSPDSLLGQNSAPIIIRNRTSGRLRASTFTSPIADDGPSGVASKALRIASGACTATSAATP